MANTDIEKLKRELVRQGFRIRYGKHIIVYPPDLTKSPFGIPRTPSDYRGMKNLLRDLKARGFIPPQGGAGGFKQLQ